MKKIRLNLSSQPFVFSESFVVGKNFIGYMGEGFESSFLFCPSLVEEPIEKNVERYVFQKFLSEPLNDNQIIEKLYEIGDPITRWSDILSLITMSGGDMPECPLVKNGFPNIFYIEDTRQILHSLSIVWNGKSFSLSIYNLDHKLRWRIGTSVFATEIV